MVGCSRIPSSHMSLARQKEGRRANAIISYHIHAFVHGRSSRGYTFEACLSKRSKYVEGSRGSSRSRASREVVVRATVVVHVHVTRVFGDGRRTWFGVVLAVPVF